MKNKIIIFTISVLGLFSTVANAVEKKEATAEQKAVVGTIAIGSALSAQTAFRHFAQGEVRLAALKAALEAKGARVAAHHTAYAFDAAALRVVIAMQLAAAGYTGVQVGRLLNEFDEKYYDGVITHHNVVAETVAKGLETARVFESYDYVMSGALSDDMLWHLQNAEQALKKIANGR